MTAGTSLLHELERRFRRLGHLVVQLPRGVVREAQQLGLLGADLRDALDGLAGVVGVALLGAVPRGLEQRLARVAIAQILQLRAAGWCSAAAAPTCRPGRDPWRPARPRRSRRRTGRPAWPCRRPPARRLGRGQQLVGELGAERRLFLVEVLQLGLVGVGQLGAGMHEVPVDHLDQALRLRIELERVALVVDRLDALEQLAVEVDRILVRGQLRRLVFLHLLQRVVGVGAGDRTEHLHHAVQQGAGLLHRHEGVVEGRRIRVVGDLLDLGQLLLHALLDRRLVVGVRDLVERRRLERQRAGAGRTDCWSWRRRLTAAVLAAAHRGGRRGGSWRRRSAAASRRPGPSRGNHEGTETKHAVSPGGAPVTGHGEVGISDCTHPAATFQTATQFRRTNEEYRAPRHDGVLRPRACRAVASRSDQQVQAVPHDAHRQVGDQVHVDVQVGDPGGHLRRRIGGAQTAIHRVRIRLRRAPALEQAVLRKASCSAAAKSSGPAPS